MMLKSGTAFPKRQPRAGPTTAAKRGPEFTAEPSGKALCGLARTRQTPSDTTSRNWQTLSAHRRLTRARGPRMLNLSVYGSPELCPL